MKNNSRTSPMGEDKPESCDVSADGYAPVAIFENPQGRPLPSILLTATLRWPIAARLAIAFSKTGCLVDAICPRRHTAAKTGAIRKVYPYATLNPLASLRAAIESAKPDFIIPCDDDAAIHLHQLYMLACEEGPSAIALRALIAHSLGTPEACTLATARGKLMALAAEQGIRVPVTTLIATPAELSAWITQHGFPAVLKVDSTWGGQGVSIVWSHEHAQRVFARMTARPAFWNAMAHMLLERDTTSFMKAMKEERHGITIQTFISGPPANRAVACWQGEVLAGISVEALRMQHPTGPATVVRIIENPEMSEAVIRLVQRLKISGLWGIDFILERSTGAAYLIEMNPRATPICHLPLGTGQDLPAALYTQLTGVPPAAPAARINHDVVALFPGELHRDSTSPYLRSGYHDVPWDESQLIQDCIDRPWSERGLIARLWATLRKRPSPLPPFHWKDPLRAQHSVDDVCNRVAQKTLTNPTSFTLTDKKTTFVR